MAFRSGSVTGKGIVYSRRRGRAFGGRSLLGRGKPSVIYEESDEDSDYPTSNLRAKLQTQTVEDADATRTVPILRSLADVEEMC
jgi:hypothetical protein